MCATQSQQAKTFLVLVPEQNTVAKLNLGKRYFNKTPFSHGNKLQTVLRPTKQVNLSNLMPKLERAIFVSEYECLRVMIKMKSKSEELSQ